MTRMLTPLRDVRSLDASAGPGAFEGYGSVFGVVDTYGDVVAKGAFKKTLRQWKQDRGKFPPMLLQHGGGFAGGAEDLVPVGVWNDMREDETGLFVRGQLLALETDLGKRVHAAMTAGALDGLSIGFMTREVAYGKDGTDEPARTLKAVDLWEVSLVTYPANGDARVTQVKSGLEMSEREFEDFLRDAGRFTRAQAKQIIGQGYRTTLRDARQSAEHLDDITRTLTAFRADVQGAIRHGNRTDQGTARRPA